MTKKASDVRVYIARPTKKDVLEKIKEYKPLSERSDEAKFIIDDLIEWLTNPTHKRCPRCERTLPLTDFGLDRKNRSGRYSLCKDCRAAEVYGVVQDNLRREASQSR